MSSPPSSASARSTNARELSGSVTSRRAVAARARRRRGAPASSSARAVAAPIPLEAPVTIARLPAREVIEREVNAHPTTRSAGGRLGLGDAASRRRTPRAASARRSSPWRCSALLAVVAFASRSGLGHESQAQPTPRYVSYAFTLFLIVFVLAIPVAAYGFLIQARGRARSPARASSRGSSRTSRRCSSSASSRSWSST